MLEHKKMFSIICRKFQYSNTLSKTLSNYWNVVHYINAPQIIPALIHCINCITGYGRGCEITGVIFVFNTSDPKKSRVFRRGGAITQKPYFYSFRFVLFA